MNVLLDLDGTLTDPGDGFVACVSYALAKVECRAYADDEIRRHVGPPLEQTLSRLIDDRSKIPAALAYYRERYGTEGLFRCRVYPQIEEALGVLHSKARLFVATSKPKVYAERIVGHFGLSRFFRAIYGSELDGTRSDKAHLVSHLLNAEALSRETTVLVGDRAQDMIAAGKNGLCSIGALWGYGTREELVAAGAVSLCETPRGLPPLCAAADGQPRA